MLILTLLLLQIIPAPLSQTEARGVFILSDSTDIIADVRNPDIRAAVLALKDLVEPPTTFTLDVVDDFRPSIHPGIHLRLIENQSSRPAGWYRLEVGPQTVHILAHDAAGLFYAVQSLRQLLPPEIEYRSYSMVPRNVVWQIRATRIEDAPRFGYRGMHLDVGRHFMSVDVVKQYIDLLAMHKFNTFHWHLTEDQGWRIEIKRYPKLTQVGAWRDSTLIGNYGSGRYDNIRYGGFYTQDEIRDVVAYAQARHITIIPEIEMPGHASAALAAYPEFGCGTGPYKVQSTWGVFPEIFCPSEETFTFLGHVLDEVMALFPSTYIHIGGDEAMKDHWKTSEVAQAVIRREGLKDEYELQSYFIRRIEAHLSANGRKLVGWDEILEGGLAPGSTVMSWRGIEGGLAAARMNHDVIMSPNSHAYFDHYQADRNSQPIAIGGFLPLQKVYSYEPIPAELDSSLHHHILGAQGNVWTEYMKTPEKVFYMAFPRVFAMSEVTWSAAERRNWDDFLARVKVHKKRMDVMGIGMGPIPD